MKVILIDKMGTDLTVVNAARVSFGKKVEKFTDKDEKLIAYLAKHKHWTPFGHPQLQLHVTAPLFVRSQLFKHKVGIVENEISRRYVDTDPVFYLPDFWREKSVDKKQGSLFKEIPENYKAHKEYRKHLKSSMDLYKFMLSSGVCPEQARMVLPQSLYTEWYWTGSLAAFARVCSLRTSDDAQYETKLIAEQIRDIINSEFPVSTKYLLNENK